MGIMKKYNHAGIYRNRDYTKRVHTLLGIGNITYGGELIASRI